MEKPTSGNARLTQLREYCGEESLDAVVIMTAQNIRYLCQFTGTAGVLIVTPNDATLYVDGRYTTQAEEQVVGAKVFEAPRPVLNYAINKTKASLHRLGFEANHLTFADYQGLCDLLPSVELVGLRDAVERLRAVKDEGELALIRRAIKIADDAFDGFCKWLKPGMIEDNVAARLEYEQRLPGGQRKTSATIVASGPRTALPHGIASDRVIGKNEPVMIDIGAVVGGYHSDLTRTVYIGKAPDEFKKMYQTVYEAQQKALDGIRAGMTGSRADALARDVIADAGYPTFGHSLGHSVGLDIHELPLLNPIDQSVLKENMVFTVEPGIYIPGFGGVRIEDMVRLTADGCEDLTNCTRKLLEL